MCKKVWDYSKEEYAAYLNGADIYQTILFNLGDSRKAEQQSVSLHYEAYSKLQNNFNTVVEELDVLRRKYMTLLEEHIKCQDH